MKKLLIFVLIVLILTVTACAPSSNTSSNSSTSTGNGSTEAINTTIPFNMPPGDGVLKGLSEDILQNYNGYPDPINKSVYANFKAVKGPWVVYFNNMFTGQAWMDGAVSTLEKNIERYKKAGLVSKYVVTNANNDLTTQIQQMQTAIEQGANLIFTIPLSPNALDGVIKQAYDKGVVVVTIGSPVTSPYAINVTMNSFLQGAKMAAGIVEALNGKGNVLMVDGAAGAPSNTIIHNGGMAVFNQNPGIKIVGTINGNWSPSVAKTATLQYLATHPGKIDAVWQQGSMFMAAVQALQQAGRPVVPVTFSNPTEDAIAYSHDHLGSGWHTAGTGSPPGAVSDGAFRIGILTLLGYGPKVSTFLQAPSEVNNENLNDWYKPSFTESSTGIAEAPAGTWFTNTMLEQLFTNKPTLPVPTEYSGQ